MPGCRPGTCRRRWPAHGSSVGGAAWCTRSWSRCWSSRRSASAPPSVPASEPQRRPEPSGGRTPGVAWPAVDPEALIADLDASQRRAVTEPAQPLAILAPAGSGKTRVLTRRIAWQSATEAIEPAHTLALTFTRKAAGELRSRLRRLGIRDDPTAGTFHAVALAQLRALHEHRGSRMPELLDRKARVLAPLVGKRGADGQIAILEVAGEIEWAQ